MRAIGAFLALVLGLSVSMPAQAQASLEVLVQNDCAREVQGWVRYVDPRRGDMGAPFSAGPGGRYLVRDFQIGKPSAAIRHVDNQKQPVPMLVYAKIKDGAAIWEGQDLVFTPERMMMAGQALHMKRFPYDVWETGNQFRFRITLTCPGVAPVVLTAEEIAAAAKAKADEAARRYRQLASSCDINNPDSSSSFNMTPDYYAFKAIGGYVDPDKGFQEALFGEDVAREQKNRRECYADAASAALSAEDKADLAARLARSDGEIAANMRQARATVEADPRRYIGARLDEVDAAKARGIIELSRQVAREDYVGARCGRFGYPMPTAGNNAYLNALRAEGSAYEACVNNLQPEMKIIDIDNLIGLLRPLLKGSERYLCTRWKNPVCVEDARWQRVADLAARDNLQTLRRAREAWNDYGDVQRKVICWRHKVNQAVARSNGAAPEPLPLACQPLRDGPPPPP